MLTRQTDEGRVPPLESLMRMHHMLRRIGMAAVRITDDPPRALPAR